MSHTTTIKVDMKNRIAIAAALCDVFGLVSSQVEVHQEPQVLHGYSAGQNRTAHVIVRKGTRATQWADMGFLIGDAGSGREAACFHDNLDDVIPKSMSGIKKHYAKHVVLERARKAGQHVDVEEQTDGSLRLTVRG